jgi:DNA replication protein DnaC
MPTGPAGIAKSWNSSALGHQACRANYSVLYQRVPKLFAELASAATTDVMHESCVASAVFSCSSSTIVGLSPVDAGARHDLLKILEERYGRRSTSSTSQFPVDKCHTFIGHLRRRHP